DLRLAAATAGAAARSASAAARPARATATAALPGHPVAAAATALPAPLGRGAAVTGRAGARTTTRTTGTSRLAAGRDRRHQLGRRLEPQGRVGHPQDVVTPLRDDADVGGHARAQLLVGVVDAQDGVVGDHVLLHGGVRANLVDGGQELLPRVGIDSEADLE